MEVKSSKWNRKLENFASLEPRVFEVLLYLGVGSTPLKTRAWLLYLWYRLRLFFGIIGFVLSCYSYCHPRSKIVCLSLTSMLHSTRMRLMWYTDNTVQVTSDVDFFPATKTIHGDWNWKPFVSAHRRPVEAGPQTHLVTIARKTAFDMLQSSAILLHRLRDWKTTKMCWQNVQINAIDLDPFLCTLYYIVRLRQAVCPLTMEHLSREKGR